MKRFRSPAKINRVLSILGRDQTHHRIQTILQKINFYDELEITITDLPTLHVEHLPPLEGLSSVSRAAQALQQATHCTYGAQIRVRKNIPIGGGLGGGASNAATTLKALNTLWGCGLQHQALLKLAIPLGCDVPFFLCEGDAIAEGYGEQITPITLGASWFLLTWGNTPVITATLFNRFTPTRYSPTRTHDELQQPPYRNDLETCVYQHYPQIKTSAEKMARLAPTFLTGCGQTLFTPCSSEAQAQALQQRLPEGLHSHIAHTL